MSSEIKKAYKYLPDYDYFHPPTLKLLCFWPYFLSAKLSIFSRKLLQTRLDRDLVLNLWLLFFACGVRSNLVHPVIQELLDKTFLDKAKIHVQTGFSISTCINVGISDHVRTTSWSITKVVQSLNQCVLHIFKHFLTLWNVLMKIWVKVYIFRKFYTVCRGLVYYYHHRSPSKVLPKEGSKFCVKNCVFTGPMMGRCEILDPIWSK